MSIATLSIDLVAKLASFESGMNRAADVSEAQAKRIDAAMKGIRTAVEGLGIAAAVTATLNGIKSGIDVLDQLDDLSEKYGIAAKDLSAYRYASEVAGTSTEAFADGLQKLSKNMAEAAGGGKEQAAIFKAMGVSVTDANGKLRSADEVLLDIADKFKGYTDGAGKAALAQGAFGKAGAELIPILNRGRDGILELRQEAEKLGAVYGNDIAKAAGDFNDNMTRLRLATEAAQVSIAGKLLPALVDLTNTFIKARVDGLSPFQAALVTIGKIFAAGFGSDDIGKLQKDAEALQAQMTITAGHIEKLQTVIANNPNSDAANKARAGIVQLRAQLEALQKQATKSSDALREAATQAEAAVTPPAATGGRKPPPVPDKGGGGKTDEEKALERAQKAYADLIARIKEKTEVQQLEVEGGAKLSEADKFAIDVRSKLATIQDKLTAAQKAAFDALLNNYTATDAKNEADQRALEIVRDLAKSLGAETAARIESNKALREGVEEIGLTQSELEDLTITRLRHKAALEDEAIAQALLGDANEANVAQMKQNLGLLREQIALREQAAAKTRALREDPAAGVDAALKDYQDQVKAAGTSAYGVVSTGIRGLEDTLTQFFSKGKADWKGYFATIAAEALRVKLVQPAVNSLLGAVGSKGLASFFGFADGAAFDALGVKRFAAGDIFGSPTLFSYGGGKRGVMGEAGPEAVMPLRRGADGKLGVVAQAGGGGTTIHQTYQIDARGADAGVELRIRQAMAQTKNETLALVKLLAAQGGSMSRATGRKA